MIKLKWIRSSIFGAALVAGLAASGAGVALAQDEEAPSHPAHIHEGTCGEDLNPTPLASLSNINPRTTEDGEVPEVMGVLDAPTVLYSLSDPDVEFASLFENPHAINIHESEANIDVYIACGDIGGPVLDGQLFISLSEENESGYSGIAVLEEGEDGVTTVTVYLAEPAGDESEAPAEATPGATG